MFTEPTLWGLLPLVAFVILVFRKVHPIVAISVAIVIGAIMTGNGLISVAEETQEGLGSFLAYVGLIIMAGGGLGKIAERTGVAKNIVSFVMNKVGINTQNKAILGTMISSTLLSGALGTLAGANAVIAPVIIPIVAAAGLSSSAVAIIFQGAGITGLWLGPFTPPMVTFMEFTGLTYPQILLYASLPLSIIMWVVTYMYVKKTLPKTLKLHPYSEEDIAIAEGNQNKNNSKIVKQSTITFFVTLLGLIIYGLFIEGGSTFAIIVIIGTAITTGLVGRLKPNDLIETFFEGAKPLIWLFFLFVLFTPFIDYVEELGGFEAVANLLEPLVDKGGNSLLVPISTIIGVAGIPGAAVAQAEVLNETFHEMYAAAGIPIWIYTVFLVVGSQMTDLLYPIGDTLGAMGVARSRDLKSMVIFGVIATISIVLFVVIISLLL